MTLPFVRLRPLKCNFYQKQTEKKRCNTISQISNKESSEETENQKRFAVDELDSNLSKPKRENAKLDLSSNANRLKENKEEALRSSKPKREPAKLELSFKKD